MRPWLLALTLCACSSPRSEAAPVDAATDEDAGRPPLDPALFDCKAKAVPTRRSTVPEACLRDRACKTRLVTGHRGAGGDLGRIAPEDTLAAIRAAVLLGVDFVETDPRPTKDGVLINLHDAKVDRTTMGTGEASAMTLAEVSALRLKTELPGDWSCERVPRFVDVLALARGRTMVLVDANKTDRVDLLVQAVQEADALDWAIFDTSSLEKIDAALKLEPRLMIMPRIEDAAQADAILSRWPTHPPVLVEIDSAVFPRAADRVHAAGHRVMTNGFAVDVGVKLGQPPSRYVALYEQGADVVQSDLPDLVLSALGRAPSP